MAFVREGAIYAAANAAAAAVPFLMLPLLTRVLAPAEYGEIVNFALLVSVCTAFAGLNAHAALGVAWFRNPREEMPAYTGTAIMLAVASTLALVPVVATAIRIVPAMANGIDPLWGAVAALTAGANVLLQCRLVLWQSQRKPIPSAALQVTASLLNVALSLLAVLALGWGGAGRNAGIAIAAAVMAGIAILLFISAREVQLRPERRHARQIVAFGLPLALHILAGAMLGTADRWVVSMQLGPRELGIYGAGAQLGMVMAVLADAFVKAYGPWLYARLASAEGADRYRAVGAIYVAIPAFLLAAGVVGTLIWLGSGALLGERYATAASVLPWFFLGGAFSGVYMCTSVLYFFSGRTVRLSAVTTSAAIVGVACSWLLVRNFGIQGAAMGYAVTQAVLALLTTSVAMWSFDLPWREPGRAFDAWTRTAFARPAPSSG